jgi:hypothetical protein
MKNLKTRDIIFITLILVLDIVVTGPILATLGMVLMTVGLQVGVATALISAIFYSILLRRVPVIGVLSAVSIARGILAGFIMPPAFWPLFPVVTLTGIIPDLLMYLFKLKPDNPKTNKAMITINRLLTTPLMVPLLLLTGLLELARSSNMMVIEGLSPIQVYLILAFVSMILEGILGYFGAVAGNKISDKLIKAGVK